VNFRHERIDDDPGWERHDLASPGAIEAGGALADLTGNGRLDVVDKSDAGDGHVDAWYNETGT